ncbi:MAG: helix-turn-helix transcriptional regulator [Treponema sp.]|nr:helix-turn-helix transcriptional regulator [Treponema sp.]
MEKNEESLDMDNPEKEPIPLLFGRNVRKYRKERGLTQEQLSEKLGISQKHLSIIETGTQFASASLIGRISEVLKVSPGDLFGGSSDILIEEIKKTRAMLMTFFTNEMNRHSSILSSEIKNTVRRFSN